MRIAQIARVSTPVLEYGSGNVEKLVWLLSQELTRLGHAVTVFAVAGSEVAGTVFPTLPGPYSVDGSPNDPHLCEWINISRAVERSHHFDVMHAHSPLWSLPLDDVSDVPIVHTLHDIPGFDHARLWEMTPSACVTADSQYQWSQFPHLNPAATIPWSLDAPHAELRLVPEDYLCYVGAFEPGKGPLEAIAIARSVGIPLIMVGPLSPFYHAEIAPLVDNQQISYAGDLDVAARMRLLGGALALVYPTLEPEPFAPVVIDAMLCGTPVAATNVGVIPELIKEGVTGSYVESVDELPSAIRWSLMLNRRTVHEHAREHFSFECVAAAYVRVYQRLVTFPIGTTTRGNDHTLPYKPNRPSVGS